MTKIVLVLTGLFGSLLVMAQEAGVEEPVEETTIAFRQILDDGGWTMQVLLVLSALPTSRVFAQPCRAQAAWLLTPVSPMDCRLFHSLF